MDFNKLVNRKLIVFCVFLILVALLKFNTLDTPYVRDAFGIYVSPSIWIKSHSFNPFYGDDDLGNHPPLFFEILALGFSIFGLHLWVGHLIILISSVFTLYFTYLIGSYLYKPKVGFIAALLLLFSPLFFAQIGMVMLDVFLIMLATMTVYFALKKRLIPYLIAGSLLVLTKEPGILIIGAITLYKLIFEKKNMKELIVYSSPGLIFLLWMFLNKLIYGWFFFPEYVNMFSFETFLKTVFYRMHQVFTTNYKFILTSFLFFIIIKFRKKEKREFITSLGVISAIATYLFCRYISNILSLIEKIFKIDLINLLQINLPDLYSFRYVLPFLVLTIFLIPIIIKSKKVLYRKLKKEVWLMLFCIFSTILFFSFIAGGYQERYMLMIYPLFFIISSKVIVDLFKNKWVYISITLIIMALFINNWWGVVYPSCGPCEENLEYLDVLKTHQDMARFIELNYPEAIILTECPQLEELTYSWGGYVNKTIKVIKVDKKDILRTNLEDYKIPLYEEFDMVYYSTGGIDSKELKEAVEIYNLTLIKKIEYDGKIAFLYGKV